VTGRLPKIARAQKQSKKGKCRRRPTTSATINTSWPQRFRGRSSPPHKADGAKAECSEQFVEDR